MVNRIVKGRRIKNKAIEIFKKAGYLVANTEYRSKYNKIDLFSLFDFLAIKPNYITFVQVTANQPHKHQPLLDFSSKYKFDVFQMVWYDRKGWIINYYNNAHHKIDMRVKTLKFKVPYKVFVELSETKEFQQLYELKIFKTESYAFVDGELVFTINASDEFLMRYLNMPKKIKELLSKYKVEK